MSSGDLLQLIVEASLALAGFAGVVTALAGRASGKLPRTHHLSLVNLLATSFASLFLSLFALAMLVAGVDESFVWRIVSGVGLVVTLYFSLRSIRAVTALIGPHGAAHSAALLGINIPLLFVCAAQVGNTAYLGAFWPFFILLVALFAIGCFSFARLLLARSD